MTTQLDITKVSCTNETIAEYQENLKWRGEQIVAFADVIAFTYGRLPHYMDIENSLHTEIAVNLAKLRASAEKLSWIEEILENCPDNAVVNHTKGKFLMLDIDAFKGDSLDLFPEGSPIFDIIDWLALNEQKMTNLHYIIITV